MFIFRLFDNFVYLCSQQLNKFRLYSQSVRHLVTVSNYTDTDEKELAYFPATLPSDNGSAGTTETSCGDLD